MNLATTCKNSWRPSAEIVDVHHTRIGIVNTRVEVVAGR
jgi:hypothetical protein